MSQVADGKHVLSGNLEALYAPVAQDLARVEEVLGKQLRSPHPFVNELVRYGLRLGGKRLRPALLLLAARATGAVAEPHVILGAVVEMIHTATLVHDDILDEATLRRHARTINDRWDNETSVLFGDYLFTHAFYLASTLGDTFACRAIGKATNVVCDGELQQTQSSGDLEVTEQHYLQMIGAKTAALCACCCQLGARYAGADRSTEDALCEFGRLLGLAFQIADDILDLSGDESMTGKSLGTDLSKQKATLPVIHALRVAAPDTRRELVACLTGNRAGDRVRLLPWLERLGSIQYAYAMARRYADEARARLGPLPLNPARENLMRLAHFVIDRRH